MTEMKYKRNFCIVAHIDHGKSTLSDRLIQKAKIIDDRKMVNQILDNMDIERERGITIKSQAVTIPYHAKDGHDYELNFAYDADNDDVLDLYAECDFGVPVRLEFHNADMTLEYNSYPAVKQIEMNEQKMLFNFLDKDFSYEPFDMTAEKLFTQFNVNFFIPYINREVTVPEEYMLAKKASSVVVKTNERRNSEVKYSVYDGMPVYAAFYEGSKRYAYASMEAGYPFVRYVDTDGDEYFETIESYDFSFSKKFISDESKQLVNNVFGDNVFSADMFLLSVEIDRNGNTINEFKEEYTAYNGKKTFWDNDDDGHWDCAYIRHSDESNSGILREEAIFYDKKGNEIVSLVSENGTPLP